MSFLELTLGVLGVWRVTHLLHAEVGPWQLVVTLRRWLDTGVMGQAMDCFDCLSLWIAAPAAFLIGDTWWQRALLWPALSGGAMVLNRGVARLEPSPPAIYREDLPEDMTDVSMRTETAQRLDAN